MSPYEVAVKMYHREHDRWRHWALFFFGFITGTFLLYEKYNTIFPFWLPCFISSFISGIWVVVAQNIRATTESWMRVIKHIECGQVKVFHKFNEELHSYNIIDRKEDLLTTLFCWKVNIWHSTTKILARLGALASFLFFIVGVSVLVSHLSLVLLLILFIFIYIIICVIFYYKNCKLASHIK